MIFTFMFGAFIGAILGFTIAALVNLSAKDEARMFEEEKND